VFKTLNCVCNFFCVNNSMFTISRFVTLTLSYSLDFCLCLVLSICNNLSKKKIVYRVMFDKWWLPKITHKEYKMGFVDVICHEYWM
jgi:hypothetical protein